MMYVLDLMNENNNFPYFMQLHVNNNNNVHALFLNVVLH